MADTICPDCGLEMDQVEKTTFTGRDMREYQCPKCGHKEIIDCGKALWEILSEANEEYKKEQEGMKYRLELRYSLSDLTPGSRSFALIRG
jgi:predicted RNA-binding Zn-ribbon protein involved in translation (DUF1610 family)